MSTDPHPPAVVRRRVLVSGRVQGVWFRDTCEREAVARGVGGWVRNRDDLRVEAIFEASEKAVEEMIAWCRIGPPHAEVSGVEVVEESPNGETGFRVLW